MKENKTRTVKFKIVDILLLIFMIFPVLGALLLEILTRAPSKGITLTGAQIFIQIDMPIQKLYITEAQVNSWVVVVAIFFLCLYLTHGISAKAHTKRQLLLEWVIEQTEKLVNGNMGEAFAGFAPFIASIIALSAFSSLISLLGLYPPTSDINIIAGWAMAVAGIITYYRFKCGPLGYVKSFCDPIGMAPLNIINEIATPVSMTFRHYGNIISGVVVSVLVGAGLQGLSQLILGSIPGILGEIPLLQIGIPAVLSVYFDIFSGCLQAYIFAMLTMMYVSGAFNIDEFEIRKRKKALKKANGGN
ncbi:MAG: F0F1 ATP synthase subunit A [Ruminococcaceae bacterium]|nr:F0F1 ATP synthase subunit A [Oscillospiraceae bacterium]